MMGLEESFFLGGGLVILPCRYLRCPYQDWKSVIDQIGKRYNIYIKRVFWKAKHGNLERARRLKSASFFAK